MDRSNRIFLSADEVTRLRSAVSEISRNLVRGGRPIPLWRLSEEVALRLEIGLLSELDRLSNAIKSLLEEQRDPHLRIIATSMPGVGYVFDPTNPDSVPVNCRTINWD